MIPIIEITDLGKKYAIMHDKAPYGTLRDTMVNFAKHPFARRTSRESFWALKGVNLTINRGDIMGIIGRNGAGKSTLLKILSGITKPSEGRVTMRGRVSSLLEVGTGFHPELTGRENIFLNGVILGMTRREVASKFDQIVEFAGVETFLDTPVKHYSSGMHVRLAFAVAAHLEPDILIADEVLAVGDAEFQKKCLGKMREVSQQQGRTVLFVSHNMSAIEQLCTTCILLEKGQVSMSGATGQVTEHYRGQNRLQGASIPRSGAKIRLVAIAFKNAAGMARTSFEIFEYVKIECVLESAADYKNVSLAICFNSSQDDVRTTSLWTSFIDTTFNVNRGKCMIVFEIPRIRMTPGEYEVISYSEHNGGYMERIDGLMYIQIGNKSLTGAVYPHIQQGRYLEDFTFRVIHHVT